MHSGHFTAFFFALRTAALFKDSRVMAWWDYGLFARMLRVRYGCQKKTQQTHLHCPIAPDCSFALLCIVVSGRNNVRTRGVATSVDYCRSTLTRVIIGL